MTQRTLQKSKKSRRHFYNNNMKKGKSSIEININTENPDLIEKVINILDEDALNQDEVVSEETCNNCGGTWLWFGDGSGACLDCKTDK